MQKQEFGNHISDVLKVHAHRSSVIWASPWKFYGRFGPSTLDLGTWTLYKSILFRPCCALHPKLETSIRF